MRPAGAGVVLGDGRSPWVARHGAGRRGRAGRGCGPLGRRRRAATPAGVPAACRAAAPPAPPPPPPQQLRACRWRLGAAAGSTDGRTIALLAASSQPQPSRCPAPRAGRCRASSVRRRSPPLFCTGRRDAVPLSPRQRRPSRCCTGLASARSESQSARLVAGERSMDPTRVVEGQQPARSHAPTRCTRRAATCRCTCALWMSMEAGMVAA